MSKKGCPPVSPRTGPITENRLILESIILVLPTFFIPNTRVIARVPDWMFPSLNCAKSGPSGSLGSGLIQPYLYVRKTSYNFPPFSVDRHYYAPKVDSPRRSKLSFSAKLAVGKLTRISRLWSMAGVPSQSMVAQYREREDSLIGSR